MEVDSSLADDLATLKRLASELLEAEAPEPDVLDRLAALAAEVAAQCREEARRKLVDGVVEAALTIFPATAGTLQSRLTQSPTEELSALAALLDEVDAGRAAFAGADSELREAHGRGDYAAMAPLALAADKHKSALAAAIRKFTERTGLGEELQPEAAATAAADEPAAGSEAAYAVPLEPSAGSIHDADEPADMRAERPRLRALIRQMRAVPEAAPVRR